jgi:hypothetical protein
MLGLAVFFFIGLYLLITLAAVWFAARWARKRGRRAWVWGAVAAFVMYNLVFWDLIPTLLIHKYYCATEAGFWVYKTPEQWVKENPGVLETLRISHLPEQYRIEGSGYGYRVGIYSLPDGTELTAYKDAMSELDHVTVKTPDGWYGQQLNERIRSISKTSEGLPFSIRRHDEKLVDLKDNFVLAHYVSFSWGQGNALSLGPKGPIRALGTAYLAGGGGCQINIRGFRDYVNLFRMKGG